MEYCNAGSISDLMEATGITLGEDELSDICGAALKVQGFWCPSDSFTLTLTPPSSPPTLPTHRGWGVG